MEPTIRNFLPGVSKDSCNYNGRNSYPLVIGVHFRVLAITFTDLHGNVFGLLYREVTSFHESKVPDMEVSGFRVARNGSCALHAQHINAFVIEFRNVF